IALLEPAWALELEPGAPPARVQHGARVPVVAALRANDAAVLARVQNRVRLALELKAGERVLATASLAKAQGEGVRFEGAFVVPEKEDTLTLTVTASLEEGGKTFASRRSVSVTVEGKAVVEAPPRPPGLDVSPSRVDLAGFADDDLKASLTVRGDANAGTRVVLEPPVGFSVTPAVLELTAGRAGTVEVRAARSDRSATGQLVLVATPLAPTVGDKPSAARATVSLAVERGRVAASSLDLGRVTQGELARGSLAAAGVSFGP